jgi:hypothetical protein
LCRAEVQLHLVRPFLGGSSAEGVLWSDLGRLTPLGGVGLALSALPLS